MMQHSADPDVVVQQIAGDYPVWERAVRNAAPELPDADVRDRALRSVLAQFRFDLSKETFAYVRERVSRAKRDALDMRLETIAMRGRAREMRVPAAPPAVPNDMRTFRDHEGHIWSVRELSCAAAWRRSARCLVFSSDTAVRRIWQVPEDWRTLSDPELERLSWTT